MTITIQIAQAALISGITVPDSKLAKEITEFIRDTEPALLFNHSSRVYYFAALAGRRRGLKFDAELLYGRCHVPRYRPHARLQRRRRPFRGRWSQCRAQLPARHNISEQDIDHAWTAIALHTTPGIPQYMNPVVALLTAGVEMDVLGIDYASFAEPDRNAVVQAYPRTAPFKEDILHAFYDGIEHKPETTFGNV
jgi:hypothetical protein